MQHAFRYTGQVPSMEERKKEVDLLLERLNSSIPDTFCQGDSNPTNMIYDEEEGR
jgi:hypothetical protein